MLEYFLINPHKIKCVCRSRDDVNADSIKRVLERQQRARNTATMFASVRDDGTETYRREALADQWELYDLDGDAIELTNLADGDSDDVFDELVARLAFTRRMSVPARHRSWPYASRRASAS